MTRLDPTSSITISVTHQLRHDRNWASIDTVVGTREDLSGSGITYRCVRCGQDVYVGRTPYPAGLTFSCEVCAVHLVDGASSIDEAVKR